MHSLKILAAVAALACAAVAQTSTTPQSSGHPQKPATPPAATSEQKSQHAEHAEKPAKPPSAASAEQNPQESVITVENLCVQHKPGTPCKTVITKSEFEHVMEAVRPNLPPAGRIQLAKRYVELMTFADKAEQAGIEKSPAFQQQLKLMRMQALANAYTKHLQETFANPPNAEIEKYYNENKPAYEEVTLKRIYIPKPVAGADKKPPLDEAATKRLADQIRARATAGEDFDKLQAEAFAAANPEAPKDSAPPTNVGARRRGQLPASQESQIFELKPGGVSPVFEEPSGFFIYKVETKQLLPLDKVEEQISHQLEEQKMHDAIQQTLNSVQPTFNDSYFKVPAEPEAKPGAQAPAHPPAGSNKPPAAPPATHPK